MVRHCPQAGQTICPGLRTVCLKDSERKKGGGTSNLLDQLKRYFVWGFFLSDTSPESVFDTHTVGGK